MRLAARPIRIRESIIHANTRERRENETQRAFAVVGKIMGDNARGCNKTHVTLNKCPLYRHIIVRFHIVMTSIEGLIRMAKRYTGYRRRRGLRVEGSPICPGLRPPHRPRKTGQTPVLNWPRSLARCEGEPEISLPFRTRVAAPAAPDAC